VTVAAPDPTEPSPDNLDRRSDIDRARADASVIVDDVTKKFGDMTAVESVSLTVPTGTILGVIGPSGAGKTTVVRMLTGALEPSEGTVRVLGENPRRFHRRTRERIGYMPQLFTLYPDLTARENADFVASLFGMLFFRRHRRVREVLELVELWQARGRRAGDLSGGMQRRLELACALVHDPALLFLDEPTTGIDPILRARIWEELQRLRDAGRTMLVTTQYLGEAEMCDHVALIANGRLVAHATPDDLRRQAVGGDVLDVETVGSFDATRLSELPIVTAVQQQTPTAFRVTVDDAGSATPIVSEAVAERGGEVDSAREYRPTFDEIFAELVRRDREARGEDAAGEELPA
jgi:ABC-2 type transport system ATP-binding protein